MPTPIRSIRISHDEWAEITRASGGQGNASEFVRNAALEKARGGQQKLATPAAPSAAAPDRKQFTCSVCGRLNSGRCTDHPTARQEPV